MFFPYTTLFRSHVVDILIGEVGGDLDEYGNVAGRGVVRGLLHGVHDRSQRGDRLQVPQPGRVRRGDVDDEGVGERGETLGRVYVSRARLRRGWDSRRAGGHRAARWF